ncbi:Chitin synthase 6 [Smittium mucronatum]|uniref:chitin synthase n=1 Tax=Smittium mucronatum TaxID=133383 RepID=A0A1R0H269_9FUNG|nr:Chitin synthase 6 [Smittium mucronatum]
MNNFNRNTTYSQANTEGSLNFNIPYSGTHPTSASYNNQYNLTDSSDQLFNLGAGYSQQDDSRQYNTGIIQKEIVEKDQNGYLSLDPKPQAGITTSRKIWVFITWLHTFLIPDFFISCLGKKTKPEKMAWREKFTLCALIFYSWAVLLFIIIGLGLILCPRQYVWTSEEVLGHNVQADAYISLRGNVYDITNFMRISHGSPFNPTIDQMLTFAGYETNSSFPILLRTACPQLIPESADPNSIGYLTAAEVDENFIPPFVHKVGSVNSASELNDPNFYTDYVIPKMNNYRKGKLVWDFKKINSWHKDQALFFRVIDGEVFNFNDYFYNSQSQANKNNPLYNFLDSGLTDIINDGGAGDTDITKQWNNLNIDQEARTNNYNCIKTLFYVGTVDNRKSVKCLFTNYMLLAFAGLLVLVIFIKFLAALQFGSKPAPRKQSKFVMCLVPCYTEGEESIKRTINSLASLDYEDSRKLIFVICDGNIVGTGNNRPTPRIVLDTLGVDPDYDPPLRDCLAVAEGPLEHNKAKVYSGLYDFEGHSVPFLVVVKVGNKYEVKKPGNRGKRDSQILAMKFLSRVFFELPMTPLELEMYHQIYHIIGINPSLFEFLFQIDADTEVETSSLNRLVAHCTHDSSIIGICGETRLQNEKQSWVTMMQVYEYFISHNMAKAFESLFGSVTCLPGCFCMYRIYDSNRLPISISPKVVIPYSETSVETLHKKNLLSLGEDRYLTTLMLKHFPTKKLVYARDARCNTIAPDTFGVYISQRRRWINSTVHNLFELVMISDLCGFCCFSMRFVVLLDLFGTLTIPTVLLYFGYLIYIAVTGFANVGAISLIIIGAVYGLQAIIYILRREWQHIGWMIAYILFFPLWSFLLPIYSFWHFDDFSWGNTRTVIGDNSKSGTKETNIEEPEFDPKSIPVMLWPEYESQLIALGTLNLPPVSSNTPEPVNFPTAMSAAGNFRSQTAMSIPVASTPLPYQQPINMAERGNVNTVSSMPANLMTRTSNFVASPIPQDIYANGNSNYQMNALNEFAFPPSQQPIVRDSSNSSQSLRLPVNPDLDSSERQTAQQLQMQAMQQQQLAQQQLAQQQLAQQQLAQQQQARKQQLLQQQAQQIQMQDIDNRMSTFSQGLANPPIRNRLAGQRDSTYSLSNYPNQMETINNTQFNQQQLGNVYYPTPNSSIPYPSNDQIVEVIRSILASSDLDNISKKMVRETLSAEFGVDMTPFKGFISDVVDQILSDGYV